VDADGEGKAAPETEYFVYDGEHIALVFDEQGEQTHRYLYGPQIDQILADEVASGDVHWALTDHQGSVRDVIDGGGNLLNHIRYDSFGNVTSQSNANVDFRFGYTGREFDQETGLHYYRARYYDASIGRFISEDPVGFGAGDANLYRYVGNSPTNYTDPTGNFSLAQVASNTAVLTAAYAIGQALFPQPAQTPTDPCDIDPTDNSGKQAITELVASLGLSITSTLAKRAIGSLADDLIRSNGGVDDLTGLTLDDLTPELANRQSPLSFELKHRNKHLPNTTQSDKLLRQGKPAHVFNDVDTMSRVEAEILTRGKFTGTVRGTDRFGLRFDESIGTRIAPDGSKIPLHYGEIAVKLDGRFHVIPRTGSAK
jgi:RHS repeat-associated protein